MVKNQTKNQPSKDARIANASAEDDWGALAKLLTDREYRFLTRARDAEKELDRWKQHVFTLNKQCDDLHRLSRKQDDLLRQLKGELALLQDVKSRDALTDAELQLLMSISTVGPAGVLYGARTCGYTDNGLAFQTKVLKAVEAELVRRGIFPMPPPVELPVVAELTEVPAPPTED